MATSSPTTSVTPRNDVPSFGPLRALLAAAVVVATGFWGWIVLFADFMVHAPSWSYVLVVAGVHLGAGVVVGLLVPMRWYLSLVAAWGSLFWGISSAVLSIRAGSYRFVSPAWLVLGLLPFSVLVGGYLGSRVVKMAMRGRSNHAAS